MIVKMIIAFNSIFFRDDFCFNNVDDVIANNVFNEKSIIKNDFAENLNELLNDVRVELIFEIFSTNEVLFWLMIVLNENEFWKT